MNGAMHALSEGAEEPSSSGYEPGIDGLRAVAVVAVLLFHAEFTWAKGGFLGVSLFFTLSGFLITKLLLEEAERSHRIDLKRFLTRRVRRLAPASYVCLLLIAACAPWFAASGQPLKLRGDLLAALFYGANWRFLASHQSYADLFLGGPSPVLHYWSLAIEEQFYLAYPVVIGVAAMVGRRVRHAWVPVAAILTVAGASIVAAVLTGNHDQSYYGTHVRAAELMVGGLAAVAVRRVGLPRLRRQPVWGALGCLAVAAFIVLSSTVAQSAGWLSHGGFAALAVLWSVVIVGVLVPGPLRAALSTPPLLLVGRLSFSLYLFHWPVYLLLTPERTGLGEWWLLALRLAVSFTVALASYTFIEHPIRLRRISLAGWRGGLAYLGAVVAVLVLAFVQLRPVSDSTFAQQANAPDAVVTFGTQPESTTAPPPFEVVVVGSDAAVLQKVQLEATLAGAVVVDLTDVGCSVFLVERPCATPAYRYTRYLAEGDAADVVVLAVGAADHEAVAARVAAATAIGTAAIADEYLAIERDTTFIASLRATVAEGITIQVVDSVEGAADPLGGFLDGATLQSVGIVRSALADLQPAMFSSTTEQGRAKVMLIGDSTSYGVAVELDAMAGDRLEVLWAGRRNCPIAPVTELRWFEGAQWTMEDCLATQATWPQLAAEFQPDVLLIVTSLPEHSDQRYAGDDTWYGAGDPRFTEVHDSAMESILAMVRPYDTITLVADSAYSPSSSNTRVDAWNSLIASWAARWPSVRVVGLAAAVEAAEAAAGGSLRPDNIHLDDPTLRAMVETVFLPAIDAAISRTQ
jgi:peptidoglycan/LPS O-acetylase OafA/YrhL